MCVLCYTSCACPKFKTEVMVKPVSSMHIYCCGITENGALPQKGHKFKSP